MTEIGTGPVISGLRKRIHEVESELNSIGTFETSPEMIESANLLRSNEYLKKTTQKQAELTKAYAEYSAALETLLSDVFEIQNDLKDVLREQVSLLSKPKPKRQQTKAGGTGLKRGRHRRP